MTDRIHLHLSRYVSLGWSIIPAHGVMLNFPSRTEQACACYQSARCGSPGKHPVGKWKDKPVFTLRDLAWARESYRMDHDGWEPNWAMVLGRSGVAALDIDQHEGGPDGRSSWDEMERKYGKLPPAPQDTRGHTLFKLPAETENWPTKIELAPGVELFTGNSRADHILYIPPSEHPSGASYRWLPGAAPWEVELPLVPAWIMELAGEAADRQPMRVERLPRSAEEYAARTLARPVRGSDVLSRSRAYLAQVPGAIQGHRGDDHTFKVACRLIVDFGLSIGEAYPLLAEWNQVCVPPWSDADLYVKLRSADQRRGPRGRLRDAEYRRTGDDEFDYLKGTVLEIVRPKRAGSPVPRTPVASCECGGEHSRETPTTDGASVMGDVNPFSADLDDPAAKDRLAEDTAAYRSALRASIDHIRQASRKYYCSSPRSALQKPKRGFALRDRKVKYRCNSWGCMKCKKYYVFRWRETVTLRMAGPAAPETVYVATIESAQWEAVHQRIARARRRLGTRHGNYYTFKPDGANGGTVTVYTTADVLADLAGGRSLTARQACDELTNLLSGYYGDTCPIRSSRGWALIKEEDRGRDEYTTVARWHHSVTDELFDRACRVCGIETETKPVDQTPRPRRVLGYQYWAYPPDWTEYQKEFFRHLLTFGVTPDGQYIGDFDTPPRPEPVEVVLVTKKSKRAAARAGEAGEAETLDLLCV